MARYSRTQLPDHVLIRQARAHVAGERTATAELIADLAEVESRGLCRATAFPSLFAWCTGELHLSEDAAYKRIQAARAARKFPALLDALADGRLHLTAVVMLAPKLTDTSAHELIAAATHKSKSEIEALLAERFPSPDLPTRVWPAAPSATMTPHAVTPTGDGGLRVAMAQNHHASAQLVPEPVGSVAAQEVAALTEAPTPQRTKPVPLSPQRFGLQFTIGQQAYDDLLAVQALLGHNAAPGDVAAVFAQAMQLLRRDLERRRCAATQRPSSTPPRRSSDPRHVPSAIRREVWKRDERRCTFVDDQGRRCNERANLELDHVTPVARGGTATVNGLRLRCRTHNQLEADRAFGRRFMEGKREKGRGRRGSDR